MKILQGDALETLRGMEAAQVQCCVTSPPYWGLRDYGVDGQLGLEKTPDEYVARMVEVFREVRRVLRDDGTLWLNVGDSYAGSGKGGGGSYGPERKQWEESNAGTCFLPLRRRESPVLAGQSYKLMASYAELKPKDLVGIPWMLAFALRADGWYLRQEIIWAKPNPMPESVTDRCTKSHESLFLLAKSPKYYFDAEAIKEPFATDPKENYPARARITGRADQDAAMARGSDRGRSGGFPPREGRSGRNKRNVWTVATSPFPEAHFATFPPKLIEPCVLAGSPVGGLVLDPFAGSGTTGAVALRHQRRFVGIELNPQYITMAEKRLLAEIMA